MSTESNGTNRAPFPLPQTKARTWNDIERTSESFWKAHVPPPSSRSIVDAMRDFVDAVSTSTQHYPSIVLVSQVQRLAAGRCGQQIITEQLAEACRHCRPIFGDIIHPIPSVNDAATWVLSGPWPFERGPWYSLD